jgi:hypothetical protein
MDPLLHIVDLEGQAEITILLIVLVLERVLDRTRVKVIIDLYSSEVTFFGKIDAVIPADDTNISTEILPSIVAIC